MVVVGVGEGAGEGGENIWGYKRCDCFECFLFKCVFSMTHISICTVLEDGTTYATVSHTVA